MNQKIKNSEGLCWFCWADIIDGVCTGCGYTYHSQKRVTKKRVPIKKVITPVPQEKGCGG